MSESDDLLEKADAFLKRYRPSATPDRDGVPVLTEVIADSGPKPAPSSSGPPAPSPEPRAELSELEKRLTQSILDGIGPHVSALIEEPLRVRLEAHFQRKLADLGAQVKADLEAQIRDTVKRAIEIEIARRRGPSRKT
jgi:hypothetical protein